MKYEVKLTPKGAQVAALSNVTDVVEGAFYPEGKYLPSADPEKEWTVGNDLLVVLGGYWDELPTLSESEGFRDVLKALTERMEDFDLDPSTVEEALRLLIREGYIECEPLDLFGVLVGTLPALGALADESRMLILGLVATKGPMGIEDLAPLLGSPRVTTSYHLRKLVRAGVLIGVRVGKKLVYRINPATVRLVVSRLTEVLVEGQESV